MTGDQPEDLQSLALLLCRARPVGLITAHRMISSSHLGAGRVDGTD